MYLTPYIVTSVWGKIKTNMNNDLKMKLLIITYLEKYSDRRKDDVNIHLVSNNEKASMRALQDLETLGEIMDYLAGIE